MSSPSVGDVSGSSSMSSSSVGDLSGSSSLMFTSAPMTTTNNSGDTCMWYADGYCQRPRSCQDCLNVAIPGSSCFIGSLGRCVDVYDGMDAESMIYVASTFTYCPSNDTTCSSCKERWLNESATGTLDPLDRCVGTSGCVCVVACEVPDRDSLIVTSMCLSGSSTSSSSHGTAIAVGVIVGLFILFVLFASGAHLIRRWSALGVAATREMEEREARREARRPVALANVPQLNLGGWTAMQDKRVTTEREQLGIDASPTLLSTAATAVVIEDGEGYRPLSPSERHT